MKERGSFIFYRSFKESLEDLEDSDKLIMYEAISDYALDRIEPKLTGFPSALFKLIRPQLEANWRKFENGCKGANHGNKGGAPQGNKNATKGKTTPKQPQNNPKTTGNVNDNVNDNDNSNLNVMNEIIYTEVISILLFNEFWDLYDYKIGKGTAEKLYAKISEKDRAKIKEYIPKYVLATPDKKFRKHPETFLRNRGWEDEIINNNYGNKQSSQSDKDRARKEWLANEARKAFAE